MEALTEQEAKLYDRQLRLWGVAAQHKLRQAKILLYGFTSVQAEICKNLVLAGIHSVTVADSQVCVMRDLGSHLFLDTSSIGKNRAEASLDHIRTLNPHVDVSVTTTNLGEIDFSNYDLCCLSGVNFQNLFLANQRARAVGTLFLATDTFGVYGYIFEDLLEVFKYQRKVGSEIVEAMATAVVLQSTMDRILWHEANLVYVALRVLHTFETRHNRAPQPLHEKDTIEMISIKNELLASLKVGSGGAGGRRSILNRATDDFIRNVSLNLNTELNPVCAIVGGIAAQEIVKIITRNDDPFLNFFFFNGMDDDNSGNVETIGGLTK